MFNPRMHEPGTQIVIGKSYADGATIKAAVCLRSGAGIPRPPNMSPTKYALTLWPTIRRSPWWSGSPKRFRDTRRRI